MSATPNLKGLQFGIANAATLQLKTGIPAFVFGLLQTGVLNGDLKAGSLTVAAGSRMRGRAEFGWDEKGGGGKS